MTNSPPIRGLRWYIGGVLFLSTVINYIDRQTLSVLAPQIKHEFGWNNQTFMWLIIAFRIAYSLGQTASGRFLDTVGIRKGLSFTVMFYSVSAMLASTTVGLAQPVQFSISAGRGRIRELARCDQDGGRMVPAIGKRLGGGPLR